VGRESGVKSSDIVSESDVGRCSCTSTRIVFGTVSVDP